MVNKEHSCSFVGLESSLVKEGVSRSKVDGIWVCSPLDEPGSKRVVMFADVFTGEVVGFQLLQGEPEGRVPTAVAEVKVQAVRFV